MAKWSMANLAGAQPSRKTLRASCAWLSLDRMTRKSYYPTRIHTCFSEPHNSTRKDSSDALKRARLDHRNHRGRGLFYSCSLFRQTFGQRYLGVLRFGAFGALVVGRAFDGSDYV